MSKVLKRDSDSNLQRITAVGDIAPEIVDISSGDHTFTKAIMAISSCSGTKVMATVNGIANVPIPAPGFVRIVNCTKIEQSGTDAADIVGWPDNIINNS